MNRVYQNRMDIQDYIGSLVHINHVMKEFLMHYFVFYMNSLEKFDTIKWKKYG
jgi:hypothetical protein